MTDKELLQEALDWLDDKEGEYTYEYRKLIEAIKARLAQPEAYPDNFIDALRFETALAQPKEAPTKLINVGGVLEQAGYVKRKEWVGLTHEEHMEIMTGTMTTSSRMAAVEAKLKDKNNG